MNVYVLGIHFYLNKIVYVLECSFVYLKYGVHMLAVHYNKCDPVFAA